MIYTAEGKDEPSPLEVEDTEFLFAVHLEGQVMGEADMADEFGFVDSGHGVEGFLTIYAVA